MRKATPQKAGLGGRKAAEAQEAAKAIKPVRIKVGRIEKRLKSNREGWRDDN